MIGSVQVVHEQGKTLALPPLCSEYKNEARRKQDKESADLPTGVYLGVNDLGKT